MSGITFYCIFSFEKQIPFIERQLAYYSTLSVVVAEYDLWCYCAIMMYTPFSTHCTYSKSYM